MVLLSVTMIQSLMMGVTAPMMNEYSMMEISHARGLYNILRNDDIFRVGDGVPKPGGVATTAMTGYNKLKENFTRFGKKTHPGRRSEENCELYIRVQKRFVKADIRLVDMTTYTCRNYDNPSVNTEYNKDGIVMKGNFPNITEVVKRVDIAHFVRIVLVMGMRNVLQLKKFMKNPRGATG